MNNKFLFLVFLAFSNFFTYANSQEQINSVSTDLENESNLPIFEEDKANLANNASAQPVSLFNISDLVKILDNVYIFLVSSNSSILLKEVKSEEELEDLKLRLSKINNSAKKDSFKSIFKKMLLKKVEIPLFRNDYVKLEKKIETSLKDKQDRLKKF